MKIWLMLIVSLLAMPSYAQSNNGNELALNNDEESAGEYSEDEDDFSDEDDEDEEDDFEEEDEDFYGDDDFISIATGTKKSIQKAPAVASVITSHDIRLMGATSVYQVLETVTGLHVYPSNINRAKSNFSIRGIHTAENPQTLVLVNGLKTTYEFNGSRWNGFDVGVELIDRIEVIRGPGSAVYGADAYSGVINIITKGVASGSQTDLGARSGSFDTNTMWLNHVNADGDFKYSFNAQWLDTKGDDERVIEEDWLTGIGLGGISLAPRALDTKRETIDIHGQVEYKGFYASAWFLKNDGGTGYGANQVLSDSDSDVIESKTYQLGYKWDNNGEFKSDLSAYYQTMDELVNFMVFPPGMALRRGTDPDTGAPLFVVFTEGLIGQPNAHDKNHGANWVSNYSGFEKHNLRFEVGYRYSEANPTQFKNSGPIALDGSEEFVDSTLTDVTGTDDVYLKPQDRDLTFISFQDEWAFTHDWELTAGFRYDKYSDFGSTFNPRLALVWQTNHNLTTKFLYGEAFRAPSFSELYVDNNAVLLGNPDLKPETIKFSEIAWDYRPSSNVRLSANIYSYSSKELVNYVAKIVPGFPTEVNQAENVGSQDGQGIELEAYWKLSDRLNFNLSYAYQDSEDGDTGVTVADAPQSMFNFRIDWQISDNFEMLLDTRWVMDRERAPTDGRDKIDDYNWTNLTFNYQLQQNTKLQLMIRNLFDSDAREPSDPRIANDLPLETRGLWLSIDYKM